MILTAGVEGVRSAGAGQALCRLALCGQRWPYRDRRGRAHVARVLSDPLAQELTHSSIPARLAYLGPDGFPRAIPIGFHCTGAPFVRCTVPHAPTVPALNTNPKAALTVGTNAFPPHVLLVRGTAAVDIVDGVPPEYLAAAGKGVAAAAPHRRRRESSPVQWDAFEAQVRAMYKQLARITGYSGLPA